MELKDFVARSLQEIFEGISEAQQFAQGVGGEIVPAQMQQLSEPGQFVDIDDGTPIQHINFDVAVTAADGATARGGIGVFAGAIGIGSQGQLDESNESVSRISFAVPVKLPKQKSAL